MATTMVAPDREHVGPEDTPSERPRRPVQGRGIAAWAARLGPPTPEAARSRRLARAGGVAAVVALVSYLVWRIGWTMPVSGVGRSMAWALVTFEALPLVGLIYKASALWSIDTEAPDPVSAAPDGLRVVVMIPTYNEPAEVIVPTIAASCALEPAHETWVLDDGDRPWVKELCASLGARYVRRDEHAHAKAGNLNNALTILQAESLAGVGGAEVVAVLDCDHVPLPTFLTATLGWFADPEIALVQGPQAFYNAGAFDDDGFSGEQGLFFNVVLPSRQHAGVGPFWCGSTALLRTSALEQIGGVATETITEDMHTTLKLVRLGWKTAYHHQTLAVGLAPATAEQYLVQRRRWGLGAMQIMVRERLWAAKRWMPWRTFVEYLNGTLWWLEGVATLCTFCVPIAVLLSGASTSTASPRTFAAAFTLMFAVRLWGARRLMRREIHWPTAFALRVLRLPVGLACGWWLLSRRSLEFEVTPKGGDQERRRGRPPRILVTLTAIDVGVLAYAAAGVMGLVPWHSDGRSTAAAGVWLALVAFAFLGGIRRISSLDFATSRRGAYRVTTDSTVVVDGTECALVDISVGGAAVRLPYDVDLRAGIVEVRLPGAPSIKMEVVPKRGHFLPRNVVALHAAPQDWWALATMSRWLFHTPPGATSLADGVPAIASTERV